MNRGKNIVVLHGWKLGSDRYKPLILKLSKLGFNVYVPDMPGNGIVPLPNRPYKLSDYVEYVYTYLHTNKLRKCIFVCHSFGGRVGLKLVEKYPELVEEMILTGVPGFTPVSKAKISIYFMLAKIGGFVFSIPLLSIFSDFARRVLYRLAESGDYYHTSGVMRQTLKNVIAEDLYSEMANLKCPVVLIWGQNDVIVPVEIAKRMQKLIKNSSLFVVPETGHDLIWLRPSEFISKFIK